MRTAARMRSTVEAPADPRFRRAPQRPARARRWRRRSVGRLAAIAAGVSLVLALGVWGAARVVLGPAFRVTRIVVHGNARISAGEVAALVESLRGQNLFTADLSAARARLLRSPWLVDASLRRLLPSTIVVSVVERVPIALGRVEGRLYLVDADGVVIDEYGPRYASLDLPVVDGLVSRGPSGAADAGRAALAARLLRALGTRPELAGRVSQVDVSDEHDAVVLLDDDPARLHLGEDRFVERLQTYLELAPRLRERLGSLDYVDLRFDTRVYVRPAPGGERVVAAARTP